MRRIIGKVVGLFTAVLFVASLAHAVEVMAGVSQANCPVTGYPINKEQFVDYQGKRVYFCCSACPEEFKKDPEKFMKKMKEQGVTLEPAGR